MHPLTLRFHDPETERAFLRQLLPRLRLQGRAAIIVGVFVYFVYGALDHLFVPPEQLGLVWIIRMCALAVPMVVLALSFTHWFEKANQFLLALVGLSAALGLIAMLWHLPVESSTYYYPGLMLATFYTYNLLGRDNPYSIYFKQEDGIIKGYQLSIFANTILSFSYNFKFGVYEN